MRSLEHNYFEPSQVSCHQTFANIFMIVVVGVAIAKTALKFYISCIFRFLADS